MKIEKDMKSCCFLHTIYLRFLC